MPLKTPFSPAWLNSAVEGKQTPIVFMSECEALFSEKIPKSSFDQSLIIEAQECCKIWFSPPPVENFWGTCVKIQSMH